MSNKPRTPWQRLLLSITAVIIVAGMWRWAVFHLYSLPEYSITSFTSVTNNAFYTIASIVIFMISGKILFDMKNQTISNLTEQASHVSEKIAKTETSHNIQENIKEEGKDGAPIVKPFSQNAVHDEGFDNYA